MVFQVIRDDFHHFCLLAVVFLFGAQPSPAQKNEIAFVSDTQAPLWVETIALKPNHNVEATGILFRDIIEQQPSYLFILGDVVNLSYKKKRWENMDKYLDSCRRHGIVVSALLGNHDVMTNALKGEMQFQQRFPDHNRTGYLRIIDSTALILLNSNFKKLSAKDQEAQKQWYQSTLNQLDQDPAVAVTLVACHHAPYSNSTIVGSSESVQKYFVPAYLQSRKARLFITGHSHNFEHFRINGKDFLVIGGGGGLAQPLSSKANRLPDLSPDYKPSYHYLLMHRDPCKLQFTSRYLKSDFSGFREGLVFSIAY